MTRRIDSLDVLRGFALLGILVMNVQSFSMPIAAYFNPTVWGSLDGANGAVWLLSHLFFDQKFITLFSLLFGAGIVLMTSKAEAKRGSSWAVHYRRMGWLLLFGAAHAWLLWYGDILFTYALAAMILFPFRKASPRKLLVGGLLVFSVASVLFVTFGLLLPGLPPEMTAQALADWDPTEQQLAAEVSAYTGSWSEQNAHRWHMAQYVETEIFLTFYGWKAGGLMLIGMALYKLGVLSAERSAAFYRRLALWGLGTGLPLVASGVALNVAFDWSFERSFFTAQFNYWGSLLVALGYVGVVMAVARSGVVRAAQRRLAAVGRTAFTNYLLQTLICTTIFYGHGFGLFGDVSRVGQALVVLGVWTGQLVLSPLWLRYFTLGPFEWLWRSLTYLRFQPIRGVGTPVPAPVAAEKAA